MPHSLPASQRSVFTKDAKSCPPVNTIPQVSPTDFQTAYDTTHLPLLKEIAGDAYPESVTRYYLKRDPSDSTGVTPLAFDASEETFGYDLIAYLQFADAESAMKFRAKYAEAQGKIIENISAFAVLEKFRVIALQDPVVN